MQQQKPRAVAECCKAAQANATSCCLSDSLTEMGHCSMQAVRDLPISKMSVLTGTVEGQFSGLRCRSSAQGRKPLSNVIDSLSSQSVVKEMKVMVG